MIYKRCAETDPIQQGDIFLAVPSVQISLTKMALLGDEEEARRGYDPETGTTEDGT